MPRGNPRPTIGRSLRQSPAGDGSASGRRITFQSRSPPPSRCSAQSLASSGVRCRCPRHRCPIVVTPIHPSPFSLTATTRTPSRLCCNCALRMQRRLLVISRSILEHKFATIAGRATVVQFERTIHPGALGMDGQLPWRPLRWLRQCARAPRVDCRLFLTEGWLKDPAKRGESGQRVSHISARCASTA